MGGVDAHPEPALAPIVDCYAGFAGDSPILEPMWQRALAGERLDDDLPIFGTGKLWAYVDSGEEARERAWLGDPAEMEGYYAEQAATLRPGTFARLHLNLWQSGEEAFVTAEDWDACTLPELAPICRSRAGLRSAWVSTPRRRATARPWSPS